MRPIICHKIWSQLVGHYRLCFESLTKIGHNNAFWLLFLHCFKIRNISFALASITGKYFRKLWPDWGCFQVIWCNLGLFMVIFKLIQGKLGTFWLPWLLLSLLKILLHFNQCFFLFERQLGEAYADTGDSL